MAFIWDIPILLFAYVVFGVALLRLAVWGQGLGLALTALGVKGFNLRLRGLGFVVVGFRVKGFRVKCLWDSGPRLYGLPLL